MAASADSGGMLPNLLVPEVAKLDGSRSLWLDHCAIHYKCGLLTTGEKLVARWITVDDTVVALGVYCEGRDPQYACFYAKFLSLVQAINPNFIATDSFGKPDHLQMVLDGIDMGDSDGDTFEQLFAFDDEDLDSVDLINDGEIRVFLTHNPEVQRTIERRESAQILANFLASRGYDSFKDLRDNAARVYREVEAAGVGEMPWHALWDYAVSSKLPADDDSDDGSVVVRQGEYDYEVVTERGLYFTGTVNWNATDNGMRRFGINNICPVSVTCNKPSIKVDARFLIAAYNSVTLDIKEDQLRDIPQELKMDVKQACAAAHKLLEKNQVTDVSIFMGDLRDAPVKNIQRARVTKILYWENMGPELNCGWDIYDDQRDLYMDDD
jgi:hypothetical protein